MPPPSTVVDHYVLGAHSPIKLLGIVKRWDECEDEPMLDFSLRFEAQATNTMGVVQGGAVASAFDCYAAMAPGVMLKQFGRYGTTKELHVRYLRPTPLEKHVHMYVTVDFDYESAAGPGSAGKRRRDEAKVTARLLDGDNVCAEATAILVDMFPKEDKNEDTMSKL